MRDQCDQCDQCGRDPADCTCPECPSCGLQGWPLRDGLCPECWDDARQPLTQRKGGEDCMRMRGDAK